MANKKRLKENQEVTKKVVNSQSSYINEQDKKVSNEAIEIINSIVGVLEQLRARDKEASLKTIETVLGKLEVLIAKDKSKEFVAVDVKEQLIDFEGSIADAVYAREVASTLLEEGRVQDARDIMLELASELDIYITLLPAVAYPAALRAIIPLIEQEKFDEAIALVVEVIDTLVLEKVVIPLPVLRAEQAIVVASELTKDKEDANKDELKELLAYAKEQLTLAQALGYGEVTKDYKAFLEEIEKIESILGNDESTKDIFESLKEKLTSFMSGFNKAVGKKDMPKFEDKK